MGEKTALQALLEGKCPQCRTGKMFKYPLTRVSRFSEMHTHCPHCKLRFEVEPGFFIGAMYVSYAMSLALFITVSLAVYLLFDNPSFYYYVIAIPLVVLILLPIMYRYSRILFLYGFGGVRYQGKNPSSSLKL